MRTQYLLPALLLCPTVASAQTVVAPQHALSKGVAVRIAGPTATNLDVTRVTIGATVTESAPLLRGLKLLQIERSGRTPVSDLDSDDGQIVPVGAGAVALQLPGQAATRVFHYQRPAEQMFGFFAVRGDGTVASLIERSGLGASKTVDPFDPIVGVAPDGATIAIAASDPKSGPTGLGDAWLIRVDGVPLANGQSTFELTGAQFLEVDATSLTFFDDRLYLITDNGIETAPMDGSALPSALALPSTGGVPIEEYASEFVRSADHSTLAILAGADETHLDLFRVDLGGLVTNVSQNPQPFAEPGFLPEETDGPHLALSPNGDFVAYEIDFPLGNELYVQPFVPGGAAHHLTPDPQFDQSIDQMSGILTGGSFVRFLAASGQQNSDLYRSSLPVLGAPILKNLTQTSGAEDPFFPNTATMLVKSQANLRYGRILIDDRTAQGQGFTLRYSTSNENTGVVATSLTTASQIVASARSPATIGLLAKSATQTALLAFDGQSAPRVLLTVPSLFEIESVTARDGGFAYALSAEVPGIGSYIVQIGAQNGAFNLVPGGPFVAARDLLYSRNGKLMFVANDANGQAQTFFAKSVLEPATPAGAPAAVAFWLR